MDLRGIDKEWRGFSDLDIKKVKSTSDPQPRFQPPRPRQHVSSVGDLESGDRGVLGDPPAAPSSSLPTHPPQGSQGELEGCGDEERDGEQAGSAEVSKTEVTPTQLELRERSSLAVEECIYSN